MPVLLLFTEKTSPRLDYICKLIFSTHLGLDYSITIDREYFLTYKGPKILYGKEADSCKIHIAADNFIFQQGIEKQQIETCLYKGINVPFSSRGNPFPFDLFSAIFYLVSRYEEYLPFEQNQYGQFKATDSFAFKAGFLQIPVVDIWILDLKDALLQQYPNVLFKENKMKTIFTYDIDVAYAYLGRSLKITLARFLYELTCLQIQSLKERWLVLRKRKKDPFDTYDFILEQKQKNKHDLIFFFLVGANNRYNRNIDPSKTVLQRLIKKLSKTEIIGIHPSYYTSTDCNLLNSEKQILEELCNSDIAISRQHYLRLSLPVTYQNLIENNITQDYTMGFAELPGFRASTSIPFYFYDVEKEEATSLLIHPVTFMEGTFIEDMKLSTEATFEMMKQFIDEVKKVNGHFIPVWHNHSLSNQGQWAGLKEVHDKIALYATQAL